MALLEVKGLKTHFITREGVVQAGERLRAGLARHRFGALGVGVDGGGDARTRRALADRGQVQAHDRTAADQRELQLLRHSHIAPVGSA